MRDGCSRRVIGWALDEYLHTDLVQAAMAVAVALRGELAEQVVLHADYAEVGSAARTGDSSVTRADGPVWS